MKIRTGIRYIGYSVKYAYKRSLGKGSFISLPELFSLYGKSSGYPSPSKDFIEWLFNSGHVSSQDFTFEIDPAEFNEDGIFIPGGEKVEEKAKRLKSTQLAIKDANLTPEPSPEPSAHSEEDILGEVSPPPAPNLEKSSDSGTVTVESGEMRVISESGNIEKELKEQAAQLRNKGNRAGIVETKYENKSPKTLVEGEVIKGGTNGPKSVPSRAIVLTPEGNPESGLVSNLSKQKSTEIEGSFVLKPLPSQMDVRANPPVNYGGKNLSPSVTASKPVTQVNPEKASGNVMNQPAMGNLSDLKAPVTIDSIVRSANDAEAIEAINACKNTKILKLAAKQLRNMGNKPKVEEAIERRLANLAPGRLG